MRAIQVLEHGGPDVLQVGEVPDPAVGSGQVLVKTDASGVNFIDTYYRTGTYKRPLPYVPGEEGTGVVTGVGEGVDDIAVGDRVAWSSAPGSYAELVLVPAMSAIPVPDGVGAPEAASALLQGMTAHYLIRSVYEPQAGETVLIHAGAGGVGLILTQLAHARGVKVITTVSTDAKEALSREAGADHVFRYEGDLVERVRGLTDGEGVAAVYDGVGASTFEQSLQSLRVRGMLALFGAASGPVPPVDPQKLNAAGSVFLTRPKLADYIRTREELLWRAGEIFTAIADRTLKIRIGAEYPLAEAAQAHRDLEGRKTTGSIVLLP
ncbi:MAG TPA: quinone oxidoreductase [Aldersonia sp.]